MTNWLTTLRIDRKRLAALSILAVVVLAYPLCKRGIILSDEGYLLTQALDMLDGKVLYRDLDAFVVPGIWFLLAGLFSVVEPTVYATRLLALAGFGCIVATVYRSTARTTSPVYAVCTSVALLAGVVWSFPAWTFAFYSPFATLFGLLGFERLLAWNESNKRRDLILAGICFGLSMLFKQNYGVFATVGGLAAYLSLALARTDRDAIRELPRDALSVLIGGLLPAAALLGYLLHHGVFDNAYHALIEQPFSDFAQHHTIRYLGPSDMLGNTALVGPWRLTYGSYPLSNAPSMKQHPAETILFVKRLHVLLYLWPPFVFAVASLLVATSRRWYGSLDRTLLAALAFAAAFFLGVFPRADSNHLMHVYQPVILLSAIVFHRLVSVQPVTGLRTVGRLTGIALLTSFSLVALLWYRDILVGHRTPLTGRGGGVTVDMFSGAMINRELELIEEQTNPGEPLLTGPGLAMLNFLADRPVPGRYYNLYAVHIGHDQGRAVVAAAREANVRTAVIEYNNFYSDPAGLRDFAPVLSTYLRDEFDIIASVGQNQHALLRRSETPRSELMRKDFLADCNESAILADNRMIREHTMFRSVYLGVPIDPAPGFENRLRCGVDVPKDARLRFLLDYTRPAEIGDDALLHVQIVAQPLDGDTEYDIDGDGFEECTFARGNLLLDKVIVPHPAGGWSLPPPTPIEVDLSALAGQRIDIDLQTWAEGSIRRRPFVMSGLAAIWMDPAIYWPDPVATNAR